MWKLQQSVISLFSIALLYINLKIFSYIFICFNKWGLSQCGGFTEERSGLRRGCKGMCPASWMKDRRRVGKGPVQEMTLQSRGRKER